MIFLPLTHTPHDSIKSLLAQNNPPVIHLGHRIDAAKFKSDRALSVAYYSAVKSLFDANKHKYPKYKHREICWVDPPSCLDRRGSKTETTFNPTTRPVPKKNSHLLAQKFVLFLGFFLTAWSTYEFFLHNKKLWKMSTWEPHKANDGKHIMSHVMLSMIWLIASSWLNTQGYKEATHKHIGRIASLAALFMCMTGNDLQMTSLRVVMDAEVVRKEHMSPLWRRIPSHSESHKIFHAMCNFQIANIVLFLLAYSIRHAMRHDIKFHKKYAEMTSILIGSSIVPRLIAVVFRFIFPEFSGE